MLSPMGCLWSQRDLRPLWTRCTTDLCYSVVLGYDIVLDAREFDSKQIKTSTSSRHTKRQNRLCVEPCIQIDITDSLHASKSQSDEPLSAFAVSTVDCAESWSQLPRSHCQTIELANL